MEGRGLQEENMEDAHISQTQCCESPSGPEVPNGLDRVRLAAVRDKNAKFTALFHHITPELLEDCFYEINRKAAPGVDGLEYFEYEKDVSSNIADLHGRLQNGSYKALPSLRAYIPKADGSKRPLGIAALEDKIVQRAVNEVLSAIYEVDFLERSYGFRPGRRCHDALDRLYMDITTRKVSWIVDADIRSFFDSLSHDWLIRFLEHRIADPRVLRLIKLWLKAGVIEEGKWNSTELGAAQGSSASPLLANVFLHYALDLWVELFAKRARGEVHFVRYADDFVVCFQYRSDAVKFLDSLKVRLGKFKLELHPDKTRLIEFGRFAAGNRRSRGGKRPETFDFLGFTHSCSVTKAMPRRFKLLRRTIRKRFRTKLADIYKGLRWRINCSIVEVGKWLNRVLKGHYNYFNIPDNLCISGKFRFEVTRLWMKILRRRSHKARMTWKRFRIIAELWLPEPKAVHPYPNQRLAH
jgi:group II intron reverse transcriptase/maturase